MLPNWSPEYHVRRIWRETNYILVTMKFASTNTDSELFRKIYKTCIQPKYEYAALVWSPLLENYIVLLI